MSELTEEQMLLAMRTMAAKGGRAKVSKGFGDPELKAKIIANRKAKAADRKKLAQESK